MSFHSPASHFEPGGDLGVVAALQKQFDDLLFARSKPNGLLRHHFPPRFNLFLRNLATGICDLYCIHSATLRKIPL